jgi:hypothetical protein
LRVLDKADATPIRGAATSAPPRPGTAVGARSFLRERAVLLLIVLYLLTLPLMTHDIRAADEIEYFSYLHSLVFDHDLDFLNEYTYFLNRFPEKYACPPGQGPPACKKFKETFIDTITPTGLQPNFGPIGTAILWSPFYLVGHVVALVAHAAGVNVATDGYSKPYLWAITLGSACYALFGLLLSYGLCRMLVGQQAAFWATLAIWLGTPVIFYSHLAPGYSHAASLFAAALFLFLWARWRDTLTVPRALWLGVVGGLIAMIREQDALFLATPVLYAAFGVLAAVRAGLWRSVLATIGRVALIGVAAVVTYLPQLLTYQILNGTPRPNKDVSDKMNIVAPYFVPVMTDPAHALPYWSPIVLVALVGMIVLIRRNPRLGLALIVGFLLTWYINGAIKTWTTAGSFGARRFLNCTPIFAVGLAYAYQGLLDATRGRGWGWRALVPVLSLLGISWNVGLIVQFVTQMMDRQLLEWPKVLLNQLQLPFRLPGIIRQFLDDPGSFYENR